jgi:hypothetical protein
VKTDAKPLAEFVDLLPGDYHADPRLSHSQLEDFRDDPALYHGRYVLRTIPFESTDDMDFGTVCHHSLLIGGEAFVEIPRDVLNADGHKKGAAWKQFAAEHADDFLLKTEQVAAVREMIAAVYRHEDARKFLSCPGRREQSINWTDEETGLLLRSRLDWLTTGVLACVVDYKTCQTINKQALARNCYDRGYFRQLDFYWQAARQVLERADVGCVLICQRKTPPYSVRVVSPCTETMAQAAKENRKDLDAFEVCQRSGVWLPPNYGRIETISAPRYTFNN